MNIHSKRAEGNRLRRAARQKPAVVLEHQTLVISRWLNLCRAGQWTPFEAAKAIEQELNRAGYRIVPKATQ